MMANLQNRVLNVLKTDGGKSSREYASLLDSDVREIQKTLAELNRAGKAYTMPKSKNNGYSWHLNAKDMGSIKYKLASQLWDSDLVL